MSESIYEEIKELSKALGEEDNLNEEKDNGQDDNGNDEGAGDRSVRGQGRQKRGKQPKQGEISELGGAEERGRTESGEGAPRSKSGTPPEDEGTSRGARRDPQGRGEGTPEDAHAPQEDGEEVLEKPVTNADFARQRRELREAKAELAKLKATPPAAAIPPAAEVKPTESKPAVDSTSKEPDKNVNYQEWLEWKLTQQDSTLQEQAKLVKDYQNWREQQTTATKNQELVRSAVQELSAIEKQYQTQNDDYMNAVNFGRQEYAKALKITNPTLNQAQIDQKIDYDILQFASNCSNKGLNPAEELYDMMIERFGYTKADAQEDEPAPKRREERPNLKVISSNRKRSASPLSGGGQGGSIPITREIAADMSIGEFSKLSPDDLAALEAMG